MTTPQKIEALKAVGRCKTELIIIESSILANIQPEVAYSLNGALNVLHNLERAIQFHKVEDPQTGNPS